MMRRPYLITGLPRSRTAWMAAFMGDCVHEPMVYMDSLIDLQSLYCSCRGVSDSVAAFWLQEILDLVSLQVLIIDRPIGEVETSLANLNTGLPITNYCELLLDRMALCRADHRVMSVPFSALNDENTMEKVLRHLKPEASFDRMRYREMNKVNIQVDIRQLQGVSGGKLMADLYPHIRPKAGDFA